MTVSLGYGKKPWGFGSFGSPLTLPTPAASSSLSSSRKYDGKTGRYIANDEGGFEAMDDTAQRVILLVAFAAKTGPFLTDRDLAAQVAGVRDALSVLTSGPEPAVMLLGVSCEASGPTSSRLTVRYRNNLTGTEQTVEPAR